MTEKNEKNIEDKLRELKSEREEKADAPEEKEVIDLMSEEELNAVYHDQENQSVEKRFEIVKNCLAYANLGKSKEYIIARAKQALYTLYKLEGLGNEEIKSDIVYYRAAARNILPSNEETIRAEFQDLFFCMEKDLLSNFKEYNVHNISQALAYYSTKFMEEGVDPKSEEFLGKITGVISIAYELKPETNMEKFNELVLETAKKAQKVVLDKSLYD